MKIMNLPQKVRSTCAVTSVCRTLYWLLSSELLEYCKQIGLDPKEDPDLMWIAREGLKAPLPSNWKPV